jgi:hypothetical protein
MVCVRVCFGVPMGSVVMEGTQAVEKWTTYRVPTALTTTTKSPIYLNFFRKSKLAHSLLRPLWSCLDLFTGHFTCAQDLDYL